MSRDHRTREETADDRRIEAAMAAHPPERWRELFAAADALEPADLVVGAGGGQELRPGVFQMRFPVYSDAINRIRGMLAALDVVVVFDWMDWANGFRYSAQIVPDMPIADVARLTTAILRGERFADGTIARAVEFGVFTAVLDRLRVWYDTERA